MCPGKSESHELADESVTLEKSVCTFCGSLLVECLHVVRYYPRIVYGERYGFGGMRTVVYGSRMVG